MFVKARFNLNLYTCDLLRELDPPFGYNGFGEFIFFRTYSRNIHGYQENWADCVIRVINGVFSIRKDWYLKNHISWNERDWQEIASKMAISFFYLQWSPPGRGLWAMGTDFIYERGSMALYNCAYTNITKDIGDDFSWAMDSLMLGVGVGFGPKREHLKFKNPKGSYEYVIPDTREGWAEVPRRIYEAYLYGASRPRFIYDEIREAGLPINGFGGISSGPAPLRILASQLEEAIEKYCEDEYYDSVMLKTDGMNQIGCCVVAGNVRRSAELAAGKMKDPIFKDLKNYSKYPYREMWGWMSNNSVLLEDDQDFDDIPEIASRVILNGEPGIINVRNLPKGRIGKNDGLRVDEAEGFNPCITGETKIAVADSRGWIPIQETLDKDLEVYCINERDEVVVRKMRNPRKTATQAKILKILFDDGTSIRVTENHRFMLRDRSFVRADELKSGDSLAVMRRYVPTNCTGESYFDKYINIGFGGSTVAEHRLIAEYKFHILDDSEHVHHKDENKLNNNPDNLELKDANKHLSDHNIGEVNPHYNGFTNDEIIHFGVRLCKKLGRRFSQTEWQELGMIKFFSEFRRMQLGSFLEFAINCAELAEVTNDPVDPRTLRLYAALVAQDYDAEIIDSKLFITKICEGCKQPFTVEARVREQASCSLSCNNTIRDYSKNVESNRKIHNVKKESLKDQQLEVFRQIQFVLKREPSKEEWKDACKDCGLSTEINRASSPFVSWNALKWAARYHNHRVEAVIEDGYEDVYNGTVDEYHNFIVGGWEYETPFGRTVQVGIVNPQCGEIPLKHREVCNVDETAPTICDDPAIWYESSKYATLYATTVSLLPTHQSSTNRIVAKNRRIGVGIVDVTGWIHQEGVTKVTKYLRKGYKIVREAASNYNGEAGIPEPIRHTTIKPGGTVPKLMGRTSGMSFPNFHKTLRRVRVARNHAIHDILVKAKVPYEADRVSLNTDVFSFPIVMGPAKKAEEVSIWEQANLLVLLQREWANNAVSNTLNFRPKWKLIKLFSIYFGSESPFQELKKELGFLLNTIEDYNYFLDNLSEKTPDLSTQFDRVRLEYDNFGNVIQCFFYEFDPNHEEDQLEAVLASIAPVIKSASLLPHSAKGAYPQMPEEALSDEEYQSLLNRIKKIDWTQLTNSDGQDERYCSGDTCERVR